MNVGLRSTRPNPTFACTSKLLSPDVADGELLEGVMHVSGRLQEGIEPFETRLRVEFHDEADGRTRIEIRQCLPGRLAYGSEGLKCELDLALGVLHS
nr:hypothetical protein GCM10020063_085230 [Dactylosporangium thailandense]